LVAARAWLELEQHRAATPESPWPEFAAYGCFSCHHSLHDEFWRRQQPARATLGAPAWGSWALPICRELATQFIASPTTSTFSGSLDRLAALAARPGRARPGVAVHLGKTAGSLDTCLKGLASKPFDAPDVERLVGIINNPEAWQRVSTWDEAAQRYLALVPLLQSWQALDPSRAREQQALRRDIDRLLERLKFPEGYDSPRGFDPGPHLLWR
jgi:hypothetical protein